MFITKNKKSQFLGRTIDFLTSVRYFGHNIRTLEAINNIFLWVIRDTPVNIHTKIYVTMKILICKKAQNVLGHPLDLPVFISKLIALALKIFCDV